MLIENYRNYRTMYREFILCCAVEFSPGTVSDKIMWEYIELAWRMLSFLTDSR